MAQQEYSWQQDELGGYSYSPVKHKKSVPSWLVSAAVAVAVSAVCLIVYTVAVLPNMRPQTVISYSGEKSQSGGAESAPVDVGGFVGMGERLGGSIVTISAQGQSGGFFSQIISYGGGSGIIVSEDGYILTNSRAISRQDGVIEVVLSDGTKCEAELIGNDERTDCAVVKIDKTGLTPIKLADSETVVSGTKVAALGRILNESLGTTLTEGTICGVNKGVTLQNGQTINLLQTDAAQPDNSGSALLNADGQLVGMVTSMISSNTNNIALAIPSNDIMQVLESIINTGLAPSGLTIGIRGQDADYGVVVEAINDGSPAQKAGVEVGDLIMKVDGTSVKSVSEINKIRDSHQKGDTILFTVYRDGETLELGIVLG